MKCICWAPGPMICLESSRATGRQRTSSSINNDASLTIMVGVVEKEEAVWFDAGNYNEAWRWVTSQFLVEPTDEGVMVKNWLCTARRTNQGTDRPSNGPSLKKETKGRDHILSKY